MKMHFRGFLTILFVSSLGVFSVRAQNVSKASRLDSTVTRTADNGQLVQYYARAFDFGPVGKQTKVAKRALTSADTDANLEKQPAEKSPVPHIAKNSAPRIASATATDLSSYAVGEIPLLEGTTPTGAKTYQIPITTASGFNLIPSVSVCYNSQGAEGWVGYGWDIAGFSSITLISKNRYYHGENRGAYKGNVDAAFALDGVPLVQNTQAATSSAYPLITATGNILVAPVKDRSGYVTKFNVMYPNGQSASFKGSGAGSFYNDWCYPMVEMADAYGEKITFDYDYTNRLRAIRYGYNTSDQYKAEILFSYESDPSNMPTRGFAGWSISKSYRLTNIVSKSEGEIICEYSFSYIQKDNISLLSQVACASGNESLPPLRFEYGREYDPEAGSGFLFSDQYAFLSQAYNPNSDVDLVYKRGKFTPGNNNDGVLIYPQVETYAVTSIHTSFWGVRTYQFGSPYNEAQRILFAPNLTDFSTTVYDTIEAGYGFQTIEAVDVDGDGLDELVQVNFKGTTGNNTRLWITIYKFDSSGKPVRDSYFDVLVKGTIKSGDFVSPYRREYYWGDFRGNGKIQLLTIAYDKNYNDTRVFDQESYAALIDLSTRQVLCDSKLFDFPIEYSRCLLVCDLDNDSQTELCFSSTSGLDVYRFQSSSFSKERSIASLSQSFWVYDRPYFITDLNGDGYIDVLFAPITGTGKTWTVKSFDGGSFVSYSLNICSRSASDEFMFIDVNQDGLADLVKVSGTSLGCYINQNGRSFGTYQPSPSSVTNGKGIVPINVMNFLGTGTFIKVEGFNAYVYQYSNPSPRQRQLTKSVDSFGKMTINTYAYLPDKQNSVLGNGWWDNSLSVNNADGYFFKPLPLYVVEKEDAYLSENNSSRYKHRDYVYFNGVVHNQGLGFCGFSKIRSTELASGEKPIIVDEIHDPQKRGAVVSVQTRLNSISAAPFATVTNTYDNNTTTYGILNPRLTESVENNTLTGITTTTSYTYGDYDLPIIVSTTRRLGSGPAQTETLSRVYQNSISANKYILGLVTEESVLKEGDGDTSFGWEERTVNTYDGCGRLSTSKLYVGNSGVIRSRLKIDGQSVNMESAPALGKQVGSFVPADRAEQFDRILYAEVVRANNLVSETRWSYDSFGNVTSKETASYGATTFLGNTYTYDSDGRYLLTETDAFGHTTTYSGYNKFGKPTTVKDYRNRTTTYVYDAWGSVTKKTSPDGTVEQSAPAWGGAGLYTVTSTMTGKPQTVMHYDALGHEVRSDVKRFNGQWQYVSRVYDSRGRLQKVSLPYRGTSDSYWNTYTYDAYDRPTSLTEASGKVSTWSYSGASTTTVKDGISSTSTTDASGNVIRVVDAGGTITYTLRDDGQPVSITAPGNVTTTFTYDDYGRRTKIVDPSAGIQTDSYVWNSDGTSVQTSVNPNGTVKTYVDKYGRTTKIERPGEYTTTYTYNSYNLLTKEQSTNGTSAVYTYDAKDRVSTVKEAVPDGKWLKKTYTYTSGSVLSKIVYESQSGTITTETYTYANGYNTKIALADGTVVRNLTAENDLGMPTAITSGSITREYGYTAFGMPTYRRMAGGALQDMRYHFDPATGNLLSRRDEARDKTETFTYDELNRLKTINARQITYDAKGNILRIGGVGTMTYDNSSHPYQITSLTTASNSVVANRAQSVSYTSYSRPSILTEGSRSAAFTYNGAGDRVKMYVANGSTQVLTRYYIGGQYEFDQTPSGTKERLYLGGDAYSAPMVYQREGSGSWTAYNIGRDYLGNITHIATASGTLVAEYSYDPWGRLRNPSTLSIYTPGKEPELFLGRGFTGHEHLTWFGLINMNARLYDPIVGRFLSPDPYVQAPDFTQNFNRYSYALNNPLRYVDQNGEWLHIVIGAIIGAFGNVLSNWDAIQADGGFLAYFLAGAAVGALSAATGAWLAGVTGVAGILAGAGVGAFTGGLTGAASGYLLNGLNNLIAGRSFNDNWQRSVQSGALWGSIGGAFSGGIKGFKYAKDQGANPWTGKKIQAKPSRGPLGSEPARIKESFPPTRTGANYDLMPDPDGPNVTLYRGTTGSESAEGILFMTDDPTYAAQYVKNGGGVVKVTIPKITLEKMVYNQDAFFQQGMYNIGNDMQTAYKSYLEVCFMPSVKPSIVSLFTPY